MGPFHYARACPASAASALGMVRTEPPQAGQVSIAIPKTRFRRCTQVIAARRSAGVDASGSAVEARWPPFPAGPVSPGRGICCVAQTPHGNE